MTTKSNLKALTVLADREKERRDRVKECARMLRKHRKLFATLEALDVEVCADTSYGSIDVSVIGDGKRLSHVWRLLRLEGFEPESRPEGKASYFCTFFKKGPDKLYLQFSSTVCKQVKVGTKMVETPVYETQCEDSGAVPSELS